jgi:hypothetical protein
MLENRIVKMEAELETYRNYVGNNMAMSDYKTVDQMRDENSNLSTELHRVNALCNSLRAERDEAIGVIVAAYRAWVQESGSSQFVKDEATNAVHSFLKRMEVKP